MRDPNCSQAIHHFSRYADKRDYLIINKGRICRLSTPPKKKEQEKNEKLKQQERQGIFHNPWKQLTLCWNYLQDMDSFRIYFAGVPIFVPFLSGWLTKIK